MIGEYMQWKVRLDRPAWRDGLDVWIYRSDGTHSEIMQPDGMAVRISDGDTVDYLRPTLRLNGGDARQIMYAFMDALQHEGIKQPIDIRVQGLFEAQTAHLQDLRTLLKLNKLPSGDKKQ